MFDDAFSLLDDVAPVIVIAGISLFLISLFKPIYHLKNLVKRKRSLRKRDSKSVKSAKDRYGSHED